MTLPLFGLPPVLYGIVSLIFALLVVYLIFKIGKMIFGLIINAVLGFISLFVLNTYILNTKIAYDLAALVITALLGVVGVAILLILHALGISI